MGLNFEGYRFEMFISLNASMYTSMRLYKHVNAYCHCLFNYAVFDSLLKEDSETRSKDPKPSTT